MEKDVQTLRRDDMLKTVFLLFFLLTVPVQALGNPLELFPDQASFAGIKAVMVAPVTFHDMENVKLSAESIRSSIQDKLKKAGIPLRLKGRMHPGSSPGGSGPQDFGVLSATVRRSTSPGSLITAVYSFTISLRFLQTARIQPSDHHGWVITWFQNRGVVVGSKRPKLINDTVEELVDAFIQDFIP